MVEKPRRAASRDPGARRSSPDDEDSASSELSDGFWVGIEMSVSSSVSTDRSTTRDHFHLARMRVLLLLTLGEVALVLGSLG